MQPEGPPQAPLNGIIEVFHVQALYDAFIYPLHV